MGLARIARRAQLKGGLPEIIKRASQRTFQKATEMERKRITEAAFGLSYEVNHDASVDEQGEANA